MQKLKMIKFWIVTFSMLTYQCIKGNYCHSISVDIQTGVNENGPIRKNYSARRTAQGLKLDSFDVPNVKPIVDA